MIEVRGADAATAGGYTIEVYVAGDVNGDLQIDGLDSQLQAAALGTTSGDPGYDAAADTDRDGDVDATDVQNLAANFGFVVNLPPAVVGTEAKTHEGLEVRIPISYLVQDREGDALFLLLSNAIHGQGRVSADGSYIAFMPEAGFAGDASIDLQASDGYGLSAAATITIHVSNAPLESITIIDANLDGEMPWFSLEEPGDMGQLRFVGDFADEEDVELAGGYLSLATSDPTVARVAGDGTVFALAGGASTLVASRGPLTAVIPIQVGEATDGHVPEQLV